MPNANAVAINPETLRVLAGLLQFTKAKDMDDLILDMSAVYTDMFEVGRAIGLSARDFSLEALTIYRIGSQVASRGNALCEITVEQRADESGKLLNYPTAYVQTFSFQSLEPIASKARRMKAMRASVVNGTPAPTT